MKDRQRYDLYMWARESLPKAEHSQLGKRITWIRQPLIPTGIIAFGSSEPAPPDPNDKEVGVITFACTYSHRCGYVWEIYQTDF